MSSLNGVPLRTAMQQGYVGGPRILTAHRALSQTFGHGDEHYFPLQIVKERSKFKFGFGDLICDGVDECIRGARSTLREGADFIKIFTTGGVMSERDKPEDEQFTIEEITAIVNEARKVRTYVASHAQGTQGIKNALIGGVRTIEHGIFLDEEGAKMMKTNDTILTPTLSIVHQIVKEGREAGTPEWGLEKAQKVVDIHVKNLAIAKKYGVKIAAGTDFTGTPMLKYGLNAMELQLLVEKCNFTPLEAIIAATKNAAEACNLLHKTGTLEGGKAADLIAVKGNPLEDIKTIQDRDNIKFVIKDGRIEVNKGLKNNS